MVPSNHSFFQYCYSNIELFSIAPCKVITLNPLRIIFGIYFFFYRSPNYRDSCRNSWKNDIYMGSNTVKYKINLFEPLIASRSYKDLSKSEIYYFFKYDYTYDSFA